jgi:hypothetical protein
MCEWPWRQPPSEVACSVGWLYSSSVQRDPVGGGVVSWWLPGSGGLLDPWGVAVQGEEETVVHLMKWVRCHHWWRRTWDSYALLEAMVRSSLAPLFSGEPRIQGRPPLTMAPIGFVDLVGGVERTSWIG